jgi:hypothetical protein
LTETRGKPAWTTSPPSAYDIVACWYPEADAPQDAGPTLRPALVVTVLKGERTGDYACRVAYGTTNLKIVKRREVDLIIPNGHTRQMGLARATRFDLDRVITLPWVPPFFDPWTGNTTPKIGALTEAYIRDYAFLMMKRGSA